MKTRWIIEMIAIPVVAIGIYMNANWFWLPHPTPFINNLEYYFLSDFIFSLLCLAIVGAWVARAMKKSKSPRGVFWFGCFVLGSVLLFYHIAIIRVIGASIANATSEFLRLLFAAGLIARLFIRASHSRRPFDSSLAS